MLNIQSSAEVQKDHAALLQTRLTCCLHEIHLLQVAQHTVANPAARYKSRLTAVNHMLWARSPACC